MRRVRKPAGRASGGLLRRALPLAVLSPSLLAIAVGVYGFIAFTIVVSFTRSKMFPRWDWVGLRQYPRLFRNSRWEVAVDNMLVFGALYVLVSTLLGLAMAILIDQKIRAEGLLRTIYLYPLALSFIVTGVVWQWLLNPGLGIQKMVRSWGWEGFELRWITDPDTAIYCIVLAGVWQVAGFSMAMFLSGLRGMNPEIVSAARIDGAPTWRIYQRVVIPALRPVFLTAFVVQAHLAIKSYDLVVALTQGGPGLATQLPSTFMYATTFTRNDMGQGATSAVMMLLAVAAVMVPYLYSELRAERTSA